MCDFSLQRVKSRAAKIADKLVSCNFGTGTLGFAEHGGPKDVAVCILPGTELAFDGDNVRLIPSIFSSKIGPIRHRTAIFRQVNKDKPSCHHDALEFPDGRIVLLTMLYRGQIATVLQLPASPKNQAEAEEQKRVEYAG